MTGSGVMKRLILCLTILFMGSALVNVAYAKSHHAQVEAQIKAQFDAAIANGDVNKAKEIWGSIDSHFNKDFARDAARVVIWGLGGIERIEPLRQLYSRDSAKLEQLVLFMSSLSPTLGMPRSSTTGKLSGVVRDRQKKRLPGATVIVAGHKAISNSRGEFSFEALQAGSYYMFVYASGYELITDTQTISPDKSSSAGFFLAALNAPPPMTAAQAKAKMDAEVAKLSAGMPNPKPHKKGTETLAGTVLDDETGAPLANADVVMTCEAVDAYQAVLATESTIRETRSDRNGHFVLSKIPVGLCDFSVMKSNTTLADYEQKVRSGEARTCAYAQRVNMTSNASHRHEHTWRVKCKTITADDQKGK